VLDAAYYSKMHNATSKLTLINKDYPNLKLSNNITSNALPSAIIEKLPIVQEKEKIAATPKKRVTRKVTKEVEKTPSTPLPPASPAMSPPLSLPVSVPGSPVLSLPLNRSLSLPLTPLPQTPLSPFWSLPLTPLPGFGDFDQLGDIDPN